MKIKRIKFQNYTAFEDQQMEFSPGINVIIGENGTGKTHLMKKTVFLASECAQKKITVQTPSFSAALCAARYQHRRPRPADHRVGQ